MKKIFGSCPECPRLTARINELNEKLKNERDLYLDLNAKYIQLEQTNLNLKSELGSKRHENDALIEKLLSRDTMIESLQKRISALELARKSVETSIAPSNNTQN